MQPTIHFANVNLKQNISEENIMITNFQDYIVICLGYVLPRCMDRGKAHYGSNIVLQRSYDSSSATGSVSLQV